MKRYLNVAVSLRDAQPLGDLPRVDPNWRCPPELHCACHGIIRGVAVASRGEAKGHGLWADATTLEQLHIGETFICKSHLTHGTHLVVTPFGIFPVVGDTLTDQLARAQHFRLVGDTVYCDLHILASADASPRAPGMGSWVLAKAATEPEMFGTSITCEADLEAERAFMEAHVNDDGDFRSPDPLNVNHYPHLRIVELSSVDVVGEGALNSNGLFNDTQVNETLSYALGLTEAVPASLSAELATPLRQSVQRFLSAQHMQVVETNEETLDESARRAEELLRRGFGAPVSMDTTASLAVPPSTTEPADVGELMDVKCPMCGTPLGSLPQDGYLSVECEECGVHLSVTRSTPEAAMAEAMATLQAEITEQATELIVHGEATDIPTAQQLATTRVTRARKLAAGITSSEDATYAAAYPDGTSVHAVHTAAARLPLVDIPDTDAPEVRNRIGQYYVGIHQVAPWDRNAPGYQAYISTVRAMAGEVTAARLAEALRVCGFTAEADTLTPIVVSPPQVSAEQEMTGEDVRRLFNDVLAEMSGQLPH